MGVRTHKEMKAALSGQGKALAKATEALARETVRADKAEAALRSITAERDGWRRRALAAEAIAASRGGAHA